MTHTDDLIFRLRDTASRGVSSWGDLQQEAADELDLLIKLRESHEGTIRALEEQLSAEPSKGQPEQRTWIFLSDADIRETIDSICEYSGDYDEVLCKKVERKIKEFNT